MKIATWNIDSLKTRQDELVSWLRENPPHVVALQETKTDDDTFRERYQPTFEAEGYYAASHGRAGRCGVAVLSRQPLEVTQKGLPGKEDLGPRLLTVQTEGLSFTTVYVPSASRKDRTAEAEAIERKLGWLDALLRHLGPSQVGDVPSVVCGDFNITPAPIDSWRHWHEEREPKSRPGFREDERLRIRSLQEAGWFDLARRRAPSPEMFTWWSSWDLYAEDKGLRLDLAFGNQAVFNRLRSARTDRTPLQQRSGNKRPDHAPVIVDVA